MRYVEFARNLLPAAVPGRKPYASGWKMTSEDAVARGALGKVPGSEEIREVPETDEEVRRAQVHYQSAGHDSVKGPAKR